MINEIKYADREEWLALRQNYIGGSDAGAVIGMNPYKSAYTLWAEKTGKVEAFSGNLTTQVGAYLEDLVAKLFTEETGKKVQRKNRMLVNEKYPFACADLDRVVVGEKAFLEIKTTTSVPIIKSLRRGGEEFPEQYYAQCVHYLAVTGLEKCYLAVLINCRELKTYSMSRDEDEIAALMQAEETFWQCVERNEPPAVDGSSSCGDTLADMYPGGGEGTVDLMPIASVLEGYMELGDRIKVLKNEQDRIGNMIREALGNQERGECEGFRVSWTSGTRSSFDAKALAAAHPELDLKPFYKTTATRTLRVKETA